MAEIDPDIGQLLSALLASPLAPLAQAAIEAIATVDAPSDDLSDERPSGRVPERKLSRIGQLDLANRVILRRLKREIVMLQRIRETTPRLELVTVAILPPPAIDGVANRQDPVELLDPRREAAIHAFIATWNAVQAELRERWRRGDDN